MILSQKKLDDLLEKLSNKLIFIVDAPVYNLIKNNEYHNFKVDTYRVGEYFDRKMMENKVIVLYDILLFNNDINIRCNIIDDPDIIALHRDIKINKIFND
jgi:SHS2 domain-containing protein